MKNALVVFAVIAAFIAVLFAVNYVVRWSSNITTSVSIIEPGPGVKCALASTSNGVGLDCDWSRHDQ